LWEKIVNFKIFSLDQVTLKQEVSNLEEIQGEIEKLEQRRKLLEDYFRSKNMIGSGILQNSSPQSDAHELSAKKDNEELKEKSSQKHKSQKHHDTKHRSHSRSKDQDKRATASDDSHNRSDHDKAHKTHSKKKKKERDKEKDRDKVKDKDKDKDRSRGVSQNKPESEHKKRHRDKDGKSEERKSHRSSTKHKHKNRERRKEDENEKDRRNKSKTDRRKVSCNFSPPHDEDVLEFLAEMSKLDEKNSLNYDLVESPKVPSDETNDGSESSTKSVKSLGTFFDDSPLPGHNEF
jgi:hypothetical protein